MDIPSLQAFIAVADSGSFSDAAIVLHITQPAVSKRIATLETELGRPLFDRVGRHVSLTEAGRALLPRARQILEIEEDSRRAIANLSGEIAGALKIGTSHHIGLHRLPPVLRDYLARYPAVALDIEFLDSEEGMRAVRHGDLELAVVTLPAKPAGDLHLLPIWDDPLVFVVGLDHPLAERETLAPAELAAYPAILPTEGTFTREVVEDAFRPYGGNLRVSMATHYLETIRMLVSIGLGWSALPLPLINDELHTLDIQGIQPRRTLGVALHPGHTLSNAARAFRDLLLQQGQTVTPSS